MPELETQVETTVENWQVAPQVQLVYNEQDYSAPLADVAPNLDPATASDAEVLEAIAYHWDIPVGELGGHQVTRPETGHLLCSEKPVFGGKQFFRPHYPTEELNPDALRDLYKCCLNAQGTYEALKLIGADEQLPGYESCLADLKAAIEKAETLPQPN